MLKINEARRNFFSYAEKVIPVSGADCRINESKFGGITCSWHTSTFSKSEISIYFTTNNKAEEEMPEKWQRKPRFIISNIKGGLNKNAERNPFEAIKITYTLISTIQDLCNKLGQQMVHIVRANKNSEPFFEQLVKDGIYYYSDEKGKRVFQKKPWDTSDTYQLYSAKFPHPKLEQLNLIEKFVIPEFSQRVIELYKKKTAKFESKNLTSNKIRQSLSKIFLP